MFKVIRSMILGKMISQFAQEAADFRASYTGFIEAIASDERLKVTREQARRIADAVLDQVNNNFLDLDADIDSGTPIESAANNLSKYGVINIDLSELLGD